MFASMIVLATTNGISVDLYGGLGTRLILTQSGETKLFQYEMVFPNNNMKDHPDFSMGFAGEAVIGMKFANKYGAQFTLSGGQITTDIKSIKDAFILPNENDSLIKDIDISTISYLTGLIGGAYKIKNTGDLQPFTAAGIGVVQLTGITYAAPAYELGLNWQIGFDKRIIDSLFFTLKYDLLAILPAKFVVSDYYQDGILTFENRSSDTQLLHPGDEIINFSHLYNHSIFLGIKFNF